MFFALRAVVAVKLLLFFVRESFVSTVAVCQFFISSFPGARSRSESRSSFFTRYTSKLVHVSVFGPYTVRTGIPVLCKRSPALVYGLLSTIRNLRYSLARQNDWTSETKTAITQRIRAPSTRTHATIDAILPRSSQRPSKSHDAHSVTSVTHKAHSFCGRGARSLAFALGLATPRGSRGVGCKPRDSEFSPASVGSEKREVQHGGGAGTSTATAESQGAGARRTLHLDRSSVGYRSTAR